MAITLKTLPEATAQQVFDQVVAHARKQNARCISGSTCKYRHNGYMCFAGCLIGDDEYKPDMETRNWTQLRLSGMVPEAHGGVIRELQRVHDTFTPALWEQEFKYIAAGFSLNYQPPGEKLDT